MSNMKLIGSVITATREMHIRPGDRLVLVGDALIGTVADILDECSDSNRKVMDTPPVITEDKVLGMLRTSPKTTRKLCDAIGIDRDDRITRDKVGNMLRTMAKDNKIIVLNPTERFSVYAVENRVPIRQS